MTPVTDPVLAWGANTNGQLGDTTTVDKLTPVAVSSLTGLAAVGAGGNHSVALDGNGLVYGWGANAARIPTPHVQEFTRNTDIDGTVHVNAGDFRSAFPEEIP